MKKLNFLIVALLFVSGCSNFNELMPTNTLFSQTVANLLKTSGDNRIENLLVGGKWLYQRQPSDCADTYWAQHFYKNKYYKSGGSTCLLSDTFSVDAENWHVKDQILYILNLSPKAGEDIILKYGVSTPNRNKLVLRGAEHTYIFLRSYKK